MIKSLNFHSIIIYVQWQAKGLSINVDDYKFNGEHLAKELCFFHFIRFTEDEIKLHSVAT